MQVDLNLGRVNLFQLQRIFTRFLWQKSNRPLRVFHSLPVHNHFVLPGRHNQQKGGPADGLPIDLDESIVWSGPQHELGGVLAGTLLKGFAVCGYRTFGHVVVDVVRIHAGV